MNKDNNSSNNTININTNTHSNDNNPINIRNSYDEVDFNNKDPLFFSSGNEYLYSNHMNEDLEDEDEELNDEFIGKKKKRDHFLIDGFDENTDTLGGGDGRKKGLFGYHKNGTKIMFFVGLVVVTFVLISIGLVYYAGSHPKFIHIDTGGKIKPTIVISIDSFRAEYLERGLTPNLQKLINDGSYRAQFTTAQFPSKTFPNHYSIATGLYPESHGIVSNHMFDPSNGKLFNTGSQESLNPYWWWGEPIWVTANKQSIKTACYFWPGCGIKIKGVQPDLNPDPFSPSITSNQIFQQINQWRSNGGDIDDNNKNTIPTLTMAYVHEVDDNGHKYGPNSKQVNDSISKMDDNIGILIDGLISSGLYNETNLIFLSDHGMVTIPESQFIYLDKLTNDQDISSKFFTPDAITSDGYSVPSPMISIFPNNSQYDVDYLFDKLSNNNNEYFKIYKKQDIPKEYYFNSELNDRIPPLVGIASPGYSIIVSNSNITPKRPFELGNHGYDPENGEMHSIFIAHGPNIKKSGQVNDDSTTKLSTFTNIEIYNLLAKLIGVTNQNLASNNGTNLLIQNIYKEN